MKIDFIGICARLSLSVRASPSKIGCAEAPAPQPSSNKSGTVFGSNGALDAVRQCQSNKFVAIALTFRYLCHSQVALPLLFPQEACCLLLIRIMAYDFHKHLATEMAFFEEKFKSLIEGDFEYINHIRDQVFRSKGKQLRPMLVFYSHKLFREEILEQSYLAASLVEIVHAASLVHDDVVDMADWRRGNASVRAMFGNKAAVLAGDYMLTNAFLKAYDESDSQLLVMLVDVIRQMSEGELLQLQYANNSHATEQAYTQIVSGKTAALFGCCCQCGAYTARASAEETRKLKEIGRKVGFAFQIKDDLLDLDKNAAAGKAYGNDLKEGKLTLPALYYLQQAGTLEKKSFFEDLDRLSACHEEGKECPGLLESMTERILASGGVEYARRRAMDYTREAMDIYQSLHRVNDGFACLIQEIGEIAS